MCKFNKNNNGEKMKFTNFRTVKLFTVIFAVMVTALMLTSCGKSKSDGGGVDLAKAQKNIVGAWEGNTPIGVQRFTFNADGTGSSKIGEFEQNFFWESQKIGMPNFQTGEVQEVIAFYISTGGGDGEMFKKRVAARTEMPSFFYEKGDEFEIRNYTYRRVR